MIRYFSKGSAGATPHIVFAATLLAVCAATTYVGVVPTRAHPYDIVYFADQGWRAMSGLRSHVDYYNPWGPGVPILLALGMRLAAGSIDGVGYTGALVAGIVGIWAYLLLQRRSSPAIAVVVAVWLALLCTTPVSLGYTFVDASQAMFYNRFAFAFLGLVIIEAFPFSVDSKPTRAGALSTGIICALLFFFKASFFGVAAILAVASLCWNVQPRHRLSIMAGGFLVGSLPFLIYLGFRVDLLYADLIMAAGARGGAIKATEVLGIFTRDSGELFTLIALGFAAGYGVSGLILWRWRFAILAAVLYGAGVMLLATNYQPARMPLNQLLGFLLAGSFLQIAVRVTPRIERPIAVTLAAIALAIALPDAVGDMCGLVNGMRLKRSHNAGVAHRVPIAGLKPWVMLDDYADPKAVNNTGATLAPYLSDGMGLLRANLKPGELVTTFDAYNPFPYLLEAKPPRGGMAAAVYDYMFSDDFRPSVDDYFGNADVVMYPKIPAMNPDSFIGLTATYGTGLKERFEIAAESDRWKMYRRKK